MKLKVSSQQANYIRDLKIHESQEEIERNEEYSIFKYFPDFMLEIVKTEIFPLQTLDKRVK